MNELVLIVSKQLSEHQRKSPPPEANKVELMANTTYVNHIVNGVFHLWNELMDITHAHTHTHTQTRASTPNTISQLDFVLDVIKSYYYMHSSCRWFSVRYLSPVSHSVSIGPLQGRLGASGLSVSQSGQASLVGGGIYSRQTKTR